MANIDNTYIKRYPIELLPGYLQTDALKKVFNATVNHLFQPESVEFLDGYVGHIPPWYNSSTDFYIPEPDSNRENYQLDPTVVSNPYNNPELTNAMFYEDLIGQLAFQGALTNNHSRLFSQEYYSWSPPIDLDMFVNYSNYYWLPNGPDAIVLYDTTDLENTAVGQVSFSYVGTALYTSTNTLATFTPDKPLIFTTGLKIIPTNDLTLSLNGQQFIIGNVGRSIQLINFTDTASTNWDLGGWDLYGWGGDLESSPLYATIARGCVDNNQWSAGNRWFHIEVIAISNSSVSNLSEIQAQRPILQFDVNTQLWNYGTNNRGTITIVDNTNTNLFGTIVGQPFWSINQIPLQDGMRILGIADQHPDVAGKILIVSGVSNGAIQLTVDTFGCQLPNGDPSQGDRAVVLFGKYQGLNILYNNSEWTTNCQQLIGLTPPLFQLYDVDGNSLNDPSIYPSSNFAGSQVFSYAIDPNQPIDPYIGQSLELDQFGDWVFNNNLETDIITYVNNSQRVQYNGYLFAKVGVNNSTTYIDSWYTAPQLSRQYIINEFVISAATSVFTIDQTPAVQEINTLPTIFVYININQTETLLINGIDYTINNNVVTLTSPAPAGSIVEIASWNPVAPENITGYYQIPLNISANPNNLPITTVSRSQFLQQFQEIIENQTGIVGSALGVNNYRDTAQQRGLGLSILQHRAPMIKLSLLNSVPLSNVNLTTAPTDPVQSMQYAENSYTRFYNRLIRALFNIATQQGFSANSDPSVCDPYNTALWLTTALNQINIGKTPASPWANTGYGGYPGAYGQIQASTPLYIPATATRLGITSAFQPMVYFDTSYLTPQLTIQTHDGARIVMVDNQGNQLGTILHNQQMTDNPEQLTNPVAAAWLQFELNMFNNLPPQYSNPETTLVFDITTYKPGRWRTTDYTAAEYIQLQRGAFDKWAINNQVDWQSNTGYNSDDPFSYNYSTVTDPQGNPIPGGWQGIYRWFYDTDRPHICPWEMLGFSQQPSWWTSQYGAAPYTSGNTALWQDLANGIIRQGPRAGTYSVWARPGLLSCIPVDTQGNLLPPVQAGCAGYLPTVHAAQAPWVFGDGGPVESAWIHSQYYPFVQSVTGYLMKPAAFIEYTWDSLRTEQIYSDTAESQWIYIDTNTRRASNQFYINRETPNTLVTGVNVPNESNLAYFASAGFEVWITEYIVSQGLAVTNYIGSIIRGGNVQLAHRMAGYINTTNFRAVVDSFGQLGYNSQIVPSENISTYLYRSTSTGTYVYSGVVIQQINGGWTVYGYDAVNPYFTTIPSNTAGPKVNIVIGNQQVTEYQSGQINVTNVVLYNTVMTSYQQVYDFLISYGRWLTSQGWVFEQYDVNAGAVLNWSQSAKEFLLWAQGSWANGTIIALSPSAGSTQLFQSVGMIQYVNGIIAGTYPVVDKAGNPIQSQNLNVLRDNGTITIQPNNDQGVYGLRLFTTTMEHAVFFDNLTAFGDVIYQPLYNLQQQRIKIYTYRANGWDGTIDAPGYIVIQNNVTVNGQTISSNTWTMTNNFEKTASDFTRYFNIDEPKNYEKITYGGTNTITSSTTLGAIDDQDIANLSKHLIGYQPRNYLENLLLDESVEFQFYQGFIRQKGTLATVNALLRSSTVIPTGSTFNYYDEWMIRVGTYGATALNVEMEYILPQADINYDPQWIRFFSATSNNQFSNVFDLVANDPLFITPPATYTTNIFGLRSSYASDPSSDIPTAGYAQLGESNFYAVNTNDLLGLYLQQSTTNNPLNPYNTVWQFITDNGEWMMWILAVAISQPSYTIQSQVFGEPTTIVTNEPHGLLNSDICVIFGVNGVPEINNTYIINSVTPTTFNIDLSTFVPGTGGTIWVYRPMRFASIFDRDTSAPPGGYMPGNLVYVDQGGIVPNAWTVYNYTQNGFVAYRQQPLQVDTNLIQSSQIFNLNTGENLASLEYFDPVKGRIPGQAQQELNYITDVDPATYNSGDTSGFLVNPTLAWSSAQLGQTWWDVSQVRYIDYEQGDESYRINTWGQIAPGTTVIVYEWIQSSIPPTEWDTAVANGTVITVNGNQLVPSGIVISTFNWSQINQYDSQNNPTTYYYFWVGNSTMPPAVISRSLSTQGISNLIQNPSLTNVPWYAAISNNSIILGNIKNLLNGVQISQRINYTSKANNENIYSEWQLIREGDPTSPINPTVWSRLKVSLVTFDGLGNDVPDYHLNVYNRYGTFIRPRQTWFVNRESASALFVDTFNSLVASSTTPIVYDPAKSSWRNYFDAAEPLPVQYTSISLNVTSITHSCVTTVTTENLAINDEIKFNNSFGEINKDSIYYVLSIISKTQFTISDTPGGYAINLTTSVVSDTVATNITNNTLYYIIGTSTSYISVNSTLGMKPSQPIVFSNSVGGLIAGNTYYVLDILSQTTFNVYSNYQYLPVILNTFANSDVAISSPAIITVTGIFSCATLISPLAVGQAVVITGTFSSGSIVGYTSGTTYYVIGTPTITTFQLSTSINGRPVVTTVSDGEINGISIAVQSINVTAIQTITNWDYQVADLAQRDGLIGAIIPGQLILVDSNSTTLSLWTIWEYTPLGNEIWTITQIQAYNTSRYWNYVTWYAAGYNNTNTPTQSVPTIAALDTIINPSAGQIVEVVNGGDGNYQWYAFLGGSWALVAQQNGSIEILPSIYQWAENFGGFDGAPFDSAGTGNIFNPTPSFDDNASTEFANIIDGIYYAIYPGPNSIELNTLFFAMTNYVVSEQLQADWIFKTSNMVFTGFNQNLGQPPLLAVDNTQSILDFINEAKPYHAQIENYTNGYSALNYGNVSVVDFDVPYAYLTTNTPNVAVLPGNIAVESSNLEGTSYYETYQAWFNNYAASTSISVQQYIDPSLVRQLSTKIIFDRISTPALVPGWGDSWSIFGWSAERINENFGAQTRIAEYYAPTPGMIPNIISDLMQGVLYKGQTIGNLGFQTEPGWSAGPWGGLIGWDANQFVIDAYLDQIIQGGQIPNYNTAIGNGSSISFPLLPGAQNPNNLVVWADGSLKLYGVDWIIPTYALDAYVVNGGSGYSVGDQINVVAGSGLVPVRLQVLSVSHGSITSVKILGKGSYNTVTPGPYQTVYPSVYPGSGTNATIGIVWDCSYIQFFTPPASSSTPNIYILYIGTTFQEPSYDLSDSIYDGYQFIQPYVDDNHPEELYPMLPRDCLIMDTYSIKNGGRPLVSTRVYQTDGVTDQFDLLIVPQSNQSVLAYLNGTLLSIGAGGDAVVNFDTKRLVLIETPAAGQILYITCIGFGGGSRSVANAYIVSGGGGYSVGDIITLGANIPFQTIGTVRPAKIQVESVGDQNDILTVSIYDPGLYPQLPIQPVSQSDISGVQNNGAYWDTGKWDDYAWDYGYGVDAKFNLSFTDNLNLYNFVGDGISFHKVIPNLNITNNSVMVVIDGVVIPNGTPGFTYFSNPSPGIDIVPPPAYGSTIIVATFDNSSFSQVTETMITFTNSSILTYNITTAPVGTEPPYVSTLVRKNGQIMQPPLMETWVGNGYQAEFIIDIDLTGASSGYPQVYVDSCLLTSDTDYILDLSAKTINFIKTILVGDTPVIVPNPILNGAAIVILCVNSDTEYQLSGSTITFLSGSIQVDDQIIITTYSQDIDYEFRTEEFVANNEGTYILADYPIDTGTIQVWYNNTLQTPQVNYKLITLPDSSGWEKSSWSTNAWDIELPKQLQVYIPNQSGWTTNTPIVISYMAGLPEAPAIAWRTTTGWDATLSTALDPTRETTLLSNVYTYSNSIEIADVTVITPPIQSVPGLVYINNELISFTQIQIAPTIDNPNRAFLVGIARNRLGTSGSPETMYSTTWYNGDGSTREFFIDSAAPAISTTIFVDGVIQVETIDYSFGPPNLEQPTYVIFNNPPDNGVKNIQITSLTNISYTTQLSHASGSTVIDAGIQVQIPGGYSWVSTPNGLQYSNSELGIFLLEHSGS